ncbi:hypothetical protein H0H87_003299 [Tephrocybe sp. NHM501043]|nr:hypothetical protein H0H87_003299 [Tephrocybe sp. NHM501043]
MATNINALTADLARLDSLLSKTELTEEEDVDVATLMKRLESAEGMAGEVEGRIDDILAKLDGILEEIDVPEKKESAVEAAQPKVDVESQPKRD